MKNERIINMMMFRAKRLLLLFVMGLTITINSFATNWYTDASNLKYLINTSDRIATLYPNSYTGDIVIPESVTLDGTVYPVVALADRCFYNSKITSISIPNTVKELGRACFANCRSLKSIELPDEITSLPDSCFYWNNSLANIKLPKKLEKIGNYSFYICSAFTQIQIPFTVTEIGNFAFGICSKLTSIELSDKIKEIPQYCFCNCSALTDIILPPFLESMQSNCFWSCNSLKEFTIPRGVTKIPSAAFKDCKNLEKVNINSNVTSIDRYAFQNCSNLKVINCYATEPPTLGQDVFDNDILANSILNVPKGSETKYKEAEPSKTNYSAWKDFQYIYAADTPEPGTEVLTANFTDDEPNIPQGIYYAGNLTYNRTGEYVKAEKYVAQCLPFDIDLAEAECFSDVFIPIDIALYNTNSKMLTLMLDKVDMTSVVKAGQPFVAKLAEDKVEVKNGCPVCISSNYTEQELEAEFKVYDTTGGSGVLQRNYDLSVRLGGTYQYKSGLDADVYKTFMSTGQFGGSNHVLPYRAYVYKANAAAQEAIKSISFGFMDETTGIKYLLTPENSKNDNKVYTLEGELINQTGNTNALKKGIYICNGRKIVIK